MPEEPEKTELGHSLHMAAIDDALRRVVVSLRGPLATESGAGQGRAGGGGAETATPEASPKRSSHRSKAFAGIESHSDIHSAANTHGHRSSKELADRDGAMACAA